MVKAALIPTWLQEFGKEAGYHKAEPETKREVITMGFDKNWRPESWDRIKLNIMCETPIVFSPSAGYSKDQKDQIMERTASAILGALAEVIVEPEGE